MTPIEHAPMIRPIIDIVRHYDEPPLGLAVAIDGLHQNRLPVALRESSSEAIGYPFKVRLGSFREVQPMTGLHFDTSSPERNDVSYPRRPPKHVDSHHLTIPTPNCSIPDSP